MVASSSGKQTPTSLESVAPQRRPLRCVFRSAGSKGSHRRGLHCFERAFVFAILVLALASPLKASELENGISLVQRGYLFTEQIDGPKLFDAAMHYAEARIPELRVEALENGAWFLATESCALKVAPPPNAQVLDLVAPLAQIASFIDTCVEDLPDELMPREPLLLQGLLDGLDPYTTVLDGRRRTEHSIQFQGKLAGIGARIGVRDDRLTLINVYPESPADKAGLKDDDVVVRIDDLSATNIMVTDAVERIRGEEGTVVNLLVDREGEADPLAIAVTRGIVLIPSVTSEVIEDVIYADISHFSQTTPQDFRTQVAKLLETAPDAKGIVIDLRRNSGGSMIGSSSIGDLFLSQGVLIRTAGRDGLSPRGLTSEVVARPDTPFAELPVVFLSSPRTASGSELLAASLRNHDRAMIIGERSYGKGTIQKTFSVGAESTLKMTVGHFLPNSIPIPGGGLVPDIEIRSFRALEDRIGLPFERSTHELPFWLRYPAWAGQTPQSAKYAIDIAVPRVAEDEEEPKKPDTGDPPPPDATKDPTLRLAIQLVSRFGNTKASASLASAKEFLLETEREADLKVAELFDADGVDWKAGPRPEHVDLEMSVHSDAKLEAGVEGRIEVTISNRGKEPLHRLRGRLQARGGGLGSYEVAVGFVAAGQSVTRSVRVKPSKSVRTGRALLKFLIFDDEGDLEPLGPSLIAVEGGPRPHLALRHRQTRAEDGTIALSLDLRNSGDAAATDLRARLEHPLSDEFEIVEGNALLENLDPGETASIEFRIRPLTNLSESAKVRLLVGESTFGGFLDPDISLGEFEETASAWLTAPTIRCLGLSQTDEETWNVAFEIEDASGITQAWLHSGDQQDAFSRAPASDAPQTLRMSTEWDPRKGITDIQVVAEDDQGLTAFYRLGL